MKTISKLLILSIFAITFNSCGAIKEGFSSQKKNSTDEFLVEKKLPLKMPPNYKELPFPKLDKEDSNKENKIKRTPSINSTSSKNRFQMKPPKKKKSLL